MADIAPPAARGAAFGLRQALDTVGAFVGPLLAVALMLLWANDFRAVFWVAVIPGMLAVLLLVVGVREPDRPRAARRINPIRRENLVRLTADYWWVVGIGAVFALARVSEVFLVLRAEQGGIAVPIVPLVMVAMNVVYAASAYPFGRLSDRVNRKTLLAGGLVVLIAADLVLASGDHWGSVLAGVALWGIHMGMTQGLLAAMIADTAPEDLRGTAFGFFNLVSGIAVLIASLPATYVSVTPDVVMADLLKTSHTDQIFSITGLPDVTLKPAGKGEDGASRYQVEIRGLDIFHPADLETRSIEAENLPCWMLDTDYNGMVICASQVFFPRTAAWDNLKRSLHAEFDDSVWDHLAGTESEPFALGEHRRIAVKVIDERGNELMAVKEPG